MTPGTAKAYRLLRAVMNTAADDGLIRRNPCRLKGAGQERSPERPVLTLRQVLALADAIDARYRALILLAVFGSLRWAELAALRRCDIDLETRTVRVFRQLAWPTSTFTIFATLANVLAAAAGANLRELMERMGHSTTRAAMIYLHSTDERQRKVADALGDLARAELRANRKRGTARGVSGANLARRAARGAK